MADLKPWTGGRLGIVLMSALGDVVRALPLLDALKRHAPSTHITWVLQPGPAELLGRHPHVDDHVVFRRDRGLAAYVEVRRELAHRPFDLVLDLQPYLKAGIVTLLTHAPVKLGFDIPRSRDFNWLFTTDRIPPRPPAHVQDMYFEFLDAIGVPHDGASCLLAPTAEARARARASVASAEGPLAGLVLASTGPDRCWLAERWAELASALRRDCGARSVLLGGTTPYETATAAAIAGRSDAEPINALGSGLHGLLALLEACDLVIAPDTGPLHMAVAMDVPVVGLFGYTNPKRAGPYRKFGELLVDAYGNPGEEYHAGMTYRPGRMARITAQEVIEKAKLGLRRYAPAPPWRRARPPA